MPFTPKYLLVYRRISFLDFLKIFYFYSVQNYLDMAKLENIRAKFEMANILAKLTSPKKQQEYANHFLMYFYTKEGNFKKLKNIYFLDKI